MDITSNSFRLPFFLLIIHCIFCAAKFEWSFQSKLSVPEAGATYGLTQAGLVGRGFKTLITGYKEDTPAIYIHTADNGYDIRGRAAWSQQAILVPSDASTTSNNQFGKWMVSENQTIIVSAPLASNERGVVYIFNGTLRHWSQIQRLQAPDGANGDRFGNTMSLHKNRCIIGAYRASYKNVVHPGTSQGVAYVYERPSGGLYWSRQAKLTSTDLSVNFAEYVSVYDEKVVVSADDDDFTNADFEGTETRPINTGSAYIFTGYNGMWSEQQQLRSLDFQIYAQEPDSQLIDLTFGQRFFGRTIGISMSNIAVGITNVDPDKPTRDSVYIFSDTLGLDRWSLQQKLFTNGDNFSDVSSRTDVYMDQNHTLIASVVHLNRTDAYVFKTFGNGYSLQQKLQTYDITQVTPLFPPSPDANESIADLSSNLDEPPPDAFTSPSIQGGSLFFSGPSVVQSRSQFENGSCLMIWMSDHFLDGWDTAVLTVRAPDLTNDTFHPHCDQIDPFYIRYCPYQPEDEGIYIVKVFAAIQARFYWELSWQVQEEATGKWYKGDFATKMHFNYNATTSTFKLIYIENEIDLEAPCYRCVFTTTQNWQQLQDTAGRSAFWPLVVHNAPYYISDVIARKIYFAGKVCNGVVTYECYQRLPDGIYILRLGGGLFGRETGFPYPNATWVGCGQNGTERDQLIFRIANQVCTPLQVFKYTSRCDRPPPLDLAKLTGMPLPVSGGTRAPTQNVFGDGGGIQMLGMDGTSLEDGQGKDNNRGTHHKNKLPFPGILDPLHDLAAAAELATSGKKLSTGEDMTAENYDNDFNNNLQLHGDNDGEEGNDDEWINHITKENLFGPPP